MDLKVDEGIDEVVTEARALVVSPASLSRSPASKSDSNETKSAMQPAAPDMTARVQADVTGMQRWIHCFIIVDFEIEIGQGSLPSDATLWSSKQLLSR